MSAREEILQRIRRGLGKEAGDSRQAAAEAVIARRQRGPAPRIGGELAARFQSKAESLSSTVVTLDESAAVPAAVAAYLGEHGLASEAVATGDMAEFDWPGAGLQVAIRPAVDADQIGITSCFCAIAETGTLMLLSGPQTPASISLLPETHIAVVRTSRLVPTMEDAFALLRAERGGVPRAINFISGPSRTGDIEQTIVLGAHGPCRVHLIIVK